MFWNRIADKNVERYERETPRVPGTDIMQGAEPRELGPEDTDKALLMVHGFVGTPNNFADLPDRIAAEGWRVRVMLLPGHGTRPHDFENTTAEALEQAVVDELAAMRERYKQVVLLGHSMGGALATLAAARIAPDKLILVSPYYAVTHHWYYVLRPETWARLLRPLVRWIYRSEDMQPVNQVEMRANICSYQWMPTKGALTAIGLAACARQIRMLQGITMPVLLIHARKDSITDPKAAAEVFRVLPAKDKKAVWLDLSDHIVFWDYDRERVIDAVKDFLDR